jgi:hypothetical protein
MDEPTNGSETREIRKQDALDTVVEILQLIQGKGFSVEEAHAVLSIAKSSANQSPLVAIDKEKIKLSPYYPSQ